MPTTVQALFDYVGVQRGGAVRWGAAVPEPRPGVYIVSTSEDPADGSGLSTAPVQPRQVEHLLQARPELTVDKSRPSSTQLTDRLRAMWPAGESVVYIGKATTGVAARVKQYYSTKIGVRSPHAGGWPVKMLDTQLLWVHFGATAQSGDIENKMVDVFEAGVPAEVRASLVDPAMPLPFANLEYPDHRRRKAHGILPGLLHDVHADRTLRLQLRRRGPQLLRARASPVVGHGPRGAYVCSTRDARHDPTHARCPDKDPSRTRARLPP